MRKRNDPSTTEGAVLHGAFAASDVTISVCICARGGGREDIQKTWDLGDI